MFRHRLLIGGEYVDGKVLSAEVSLQGIRDLCDIPEYERRFEGNRAETVGRDAPRRAVGRSTGHDRNAGCEMPEALPQFQNVGRIVDLIHRGAHPCGWIRGSSRT